MKIKQDSAATETKAINDHERLKKLISHHDHLYYCLDRPEITDYEYDQLYHQLLDFEQKHQNLDLSDSPSQRMVGKALDAFIKQAHRLPMLSLQNSYSVEDIHDFDRRVSKVLNLPEGSIEYFCEPKFDGLALELIYQDGRLQ